MTDDSARDDPRQRHRGSRHRHYRRRLVRHLMTTTFPRAHPDASVEAVRRGLEGSRWDEAGHVYVVDEKGKFLGQVPIERILAESAGRPVSALIERRPVEVQPDEPAEAAALVAVQQHESDVAVVDEDGRLIGVVPTPRLLALLHAEHVEDALRAAGVERSHPIPHADYALWSAYRSRIRWLLVGLFGGLGAAFIVRLFEASIQAQVLLVAFLPAVVYLADAIGTQTEAIIVRSLAVGKERFVVQLAREGMLGVLLGLSLGVAALAALYVVGVPGDLVIVVALSIVTTSIVATILATTICWAAAAIGSDPAFASGPVATVLQDVVSVATYLGIATWMLA